MVNEQRLLSPGAAVRKLTGQPAARLGLSDRGVLRAGARADVTVFDPAAFAERATTYEPNQLATGVAHVSSTACTRCATGADRRAWRDGASPMIASPSRP